MLSTFRCKRERNSRWYIQVQERTELTVVHSGARENGTHGGTFRCKRERNSRWYIQVQERMELTVAVLRGVCPLPCWGHQSHRRPFQGRTWGRRSNEGPWSFRRLPCHQFQPEGQGRHGPPRRGPCHPFLPSQPWKSQAMQCSWCLRQDMGNTFSFQ